MLRLRDESWDRDFCALFEQLEDQFGFVDNQSRVNLPTAQIRVPPLESAELVEALGNLNGWVTVESTVPKNYPKPRQELMRSFDFRSFASAIEFMKQAVPLIEEHQHHPRWENQWRTVSIYLSTWDIGNRISRLDVVLARALDDLYRNYKKSEV